MHTIVRKLYSPGTCAQPHTKLCSYTIPIGSMASTPALGDNLISCECTITTNNTIAACKVL